MTLYFALAPADQNEFEQADTQWWAGQALSGLSAAAASLGFSGAFEAVQASFGKLAAGSLDPEYEVEKVAMLIALKVALEGPSNLTLSDDTGATLEPARPDGWDLVLQRVCNLTDASMPKWRDALVTLGVMPRPMDLSSLVVADVAAAGEMSFCF